MKELRALKVIEIYILKDYSKSPSKMFSASDYPNTIFLSLDPNEVCDKLKLLLQEKQARNISNIIDEEIVAIRNKLLEFKCISNKHQKNLLVKR